ncbi:MAG: polyphosphate polymerase domain-containing protein [Clostridia bacterium]|nr:polyphosphate polymerase domain-containing protein [Clostridia bacterium]
MIRNCFKRYEKKFLISRAQYEAMLEGMKGHMEPDAHPRYTICNLYYDTDNWQLIRESIEKPVYKEKLRVRSYGPARDTDKLFIEIKKKYDGVVYKRRIVLPAGEAAAYLQGEPLKAPNQISREIDWMRSRLDLKPKVFIAYDREAWAGAKGVEDPELRITFDTGLRWREDRLDLREADDGAPLLPAGSVLMEIKIPDAAPLWLARLLSDNGIRMSSFSKYGTYYKTVVLARERAAAYKQKAVTALPRESGAGIPPAATRKETKRNVHHYA